jgi:hypothetical protein
VLRLLLHIWSGSADSSMGWHRRCQALLQGEGAPYRASLVTRCSSIIYIASSNSCSVHWARHCMQCSSEPDCGLLYVVQTAFGRVVECGRVICA